MATGQQVYVDWLWRSWLGGKRFMSMLAVNNESLRSVVNRKAVFGCDDMSAVDRPSGTWELRFMATGDPTVHKVRS